MSQLLFLGIDGGQSSTTALIGDEQGRILGWGRDGPCNHVSSAEAREKFLRVVLACLSQACRRASVDVETAKFVAVCCGMSGGPADKAEILATAMNAHRIIVTNDAETALAGALAGEIGTVVIAGTGSIAMGRGIKKILVRAGGWGYLFGDEGSAFEIVRGALRAALRFEEGWGPPTTLREMLLAAAECRTVNEVLHLFYSPQWPRPRIAALAAEVDREASQGDSVARGVLEQAAQSLAGLASYVRTRLPDHLDAGRVAYSGGVFRSHIVLDRFSRLIQLSDNTQCVPPAYDPAAGALLLAYSAEGQTVALTNVPVLK